MKKKTKQLALLLATLMVVLSLPLSASAGFSDISDAETARNVEILQMMGVISGVSYHQFDPNGVLTRAQFTKMAVSVLGKADQIGNFKSFTIFPDVKSSHWASGYVNFAVRGEQKFISGFADGNFGPDRTISYGEAVTILMRLLGYKDEDVGLAWPSGYLSAAATAGLTEGLSLGGSDAITRAQTAKLFVNLLGTPTKADKTRQFGESVSSAVQKDVILLNANAKLDNGSLAVKTSTSTTKLSNGQVPTLLQGLRGTLLLDAKGNAWGFVPSKVGSAKELIVSKAKAGSITDKNGQEYTLTAKVKAYYDGKELTYGEVFVNLRTGTRVTLHIGADNKVESLYVGDRTSETAIVIDRDGNGTRLASLTGGRKDYKIIRNGEQVPPAALRTYDVATYRAAENEVQITTSRLSGRYDNAYPNAQAPTYIKLCGQKFDVLPSALSSLGSFAVGDKITLLLTPDAQVAGAVDARNVSGNAIGVASISGSTATVELPEGLKLEGKFDGDAASYDGQLVSVSSWKAGYLSLNPIQKNSSNASLDVAKASLGQYPLTADVKLYERVEKGPVARITLDDIRMAKVPASKLQYCRINDNGKVDLLILDNVTGNQYRYGICYTTYEEHPVDNSILGGSDKYTLEKITLKTANKEAKEVTLGPYSGMSLGSENWVGLVVDGKGTVISSVKLQRLDGVTNAAWESDAAVLLNGKSYAVSDEVVCYNRTTGLWPTLNEARAFGERMTLYVDDFDVVRAIQVS